MTGPIPWKKKWWREGNFSEPLGCFRALHESDQRICYYDPFFALRFSGLHGEEKQNRVYLDEEKEIASRVAFFSLDRGFLGSAVISFSWRFSFRVSRSRFRRHGSNSLELFFFPTADYGSQIL